MEEKRKQEIIGREFGVGNWIGISIE